MFTKTKNDKNGNQFAIVNHYIALNQLTRTLTRNYKVSFTYDAEGLRTSKTVNGEKTVFVWDGDQLVMEFSESGKVQKRYIRGNDRGYGSNLVYADKGTDTEKQYYVTDPHGNVVQLTDESGKVIKTYEYDSFGNEVKPDGKDDNPFRYCGEYYDKETEEIYLRARYYQPEVGRFLTRDTYTGKENEPLSLHLYTYCENDGVDNADPSGHKKSYKTKLYSVSGHNCYLVSKKKWKGGYSKKSIKWRKFAKKQGLFEYFTGNMDIDCDGSGKPKNYGYKAHSTRQPETAVTYSNGDCLNAFETK